METLIKYAIGVDVSKDKFDACFCEINTNQQVKIKASRGFANSEKGFSEMLCWLTKYKKQDVPLVTCMEATGVYYEKLAFYLYKNHYSVAIVLPNKAKKYMQSLGLKSKNDKIDASGIARMAAEQNLDIWEPMGDFFYKLRQMTRHYEQLQISKNQFSNQLHALEHGAFEVKFIKEQHAKLIAYVDKQIKQVVNAIQKHVDSDPEVKQKVENICKIKGVGILTVATIIAETNGFALFKNVGQLVSYAGYDVVENQSGYHIGKTKISKKGNAHIRRILHMSALSTVTCQQKPFVDLYNRVYSKTNIKMKGYVAVQKKLLMLIYTLWKKNEEFNPNIISSNDELKPLFLHGSERTKKKESVNQKKIAPINTEATLDKLPYNESIEALFLQPQKY